MATWRTITTRLFCGLLLCGLLAACTVADRAPVKPLPQDFTLGLSQSGGRFILLQGEEVRIRLPADRAAGQRWRLVNEAPGTEVLSLVEEPTHESGTETWHFRALGTGPTSLYFTSRAGSGPAAREAIFSFELR